MPSMSKPGSGGSPKESHRQVPGMPGKPSVQKSDKSSSPKNSSDVGPRNGKGSSGSSLNPKYNE